MINTLPLRLTILHLAQRFLTDGETFISKSPYKRPFLDTNGQDYYYILSFIIRPDYRKYRNGSKDSQD